MIAQISLAAFVLTLSLGASPSDPPELLVVSIARGQDDAAGTKEHPLKSISAAIARLPDPLMNSVTISVEPGTYATTGGHGMSERSLELSRRMRAGVRVRIASSEAVFAWNGGEPLVDVREGSWELSHLVVGSSSEGQKRGVQVSGPAEAIVDGVEFRLRSSSDAGLYARRGGRIVLRGAVRLNAPPPEEKESFCGILATDHGVIEFDERDGSSLVLGNGNLSVGNYGRIALGCATARIESRTGGNCLSIGNGGRIDLRNTETTLRATDPKNTPIGLEDDGHVLAEDAHVVIEGPNDAAIALQKASTFFCNDVELKGKFDHALWASSGSIFVGSFLGDVGRLEATTGASIHIERLKGKVVGHLEAKSGGVISLPDRVVGSR
jgi:hypothetical protein